VYIDVYFILAVILYLIFYFINMATIETMIIVIAIGVLWIMIRLVIIQYTVDLIERRVKELNAVRGNECV
jgi:hypothetical protein